MKVTAESDNKRREARASCLVPVEGPQVLKEAHTFDLSHGGIGFISKEEIPINKEVMMALDIEEGRDPVFVVGKVRWVQPLDGAFRIGLSFENVLKGATRRFDQYFHKK